jgi:hypothetical protein
MVKEEDILNGGSMCGVNEDKYYSCHTQRKL